MKSCGKPRKKKAASATAAKQAEQDPCKRIHDLRTALGKELLNLSERFEEEVNTFKQLSRAIDDKKEELQTLYSIEAAAADLAVLIAAQNEKKSNFDHEMQTAKNAFEQEKAAAAAAYEEEKTRRQRQTEREKEEYEYDLKREREQKQNKLKDDLMQMEKEIKQQKELFDAETAGRSEELDKREKIIIEREKAINDLQAQVEAAPLEKEQAIKQAVQANTERLNAEFAAKQALQKATYDGEKSVQASKIDALEKLVASQAAQLEQLSNKQEQAYQKVQDIANRAVDAARREIISFPQTKNQE